MMIETLKEQGHHLVGSHSSVKTCFWLKRSLRDEGVCYKKTFYGISPHRCIQMTPSLECNQRCLHCWRPIELNFTTEHWDPPEYIVDGIIKEQLRLVSGFKGSTKTNLRKYQEAMHPKHVAISLEGEPTLYPYLDELISEFHSRGMTTILVTNGTRPDVLAEVKPTQLYVSVNAPDEETYLKACNSLKNEWKNLQETLELLPSLETRTVIRITLADRLNLRNPVEYARLISKAEPNFVEAKAYMHLGFSRKRLSRDQMLSHEKVRDFAEGLSSQLGYELEDEVPISRVALLSKGDKNRKIMT